MGNTKKKQNGEALIPLLVFSEENENRKKAEALAKKLNVVIAETKEDAEKANLLLVYNENGLSLVGNEMILQGDFSDMKRRIRTENLRGEMLVKAAKRKDGKSNPTAIDATAGLGEDSFLLAAAGFTVELYEYNPIIAALLQDALERGKEDPEIREIIGRMTLREENSCEALENRSVPPDVILLDPMFPSRRKSGLIKKKFQLLQQLEHPCDNEEALVHAAIKAHPRKIIIKRPLKGPYLAGIKPSYSLSGKAIRYDCLVFAEETK